MSLLNSKQLMASAATPAPTPSASGSPTDDNQRHPSKPLMTRKQALAFLLEHGFPITEAYFNKLCLPSRNAGPPVAKLWGGGRPLYHADKVLAWAEARCRPQHVA
jgi:hypothetical protein